MPVKMFYVQGNKNIVGLEAEINQWQESLGHKASVTHVSTATTEHLEKSTNEWETRLVVTIWYEP
jgi:cell shape-determining protein MreC